MKSSIAAGRKIISSELRPWSSAGKGWVVCPNLFYNMEHSLLLFFITSIFLSCLYFWFSVNLRIFLQCIGFIFSALTWIFLCQIPQMQPSPLPQRNGLWVWRRPSWCVAAEDTPNLRMPPGNGTVSLPATQDMNCSPQSGLQQQSTVFGLLLQFYSLHSTGMCLKTCKSHFDTHWTTGVLHLLSFFIAV